MCLNKKREVHVLGMYKYESCTLIQAGTPTLGFAIKLRNDRGSYQSGVMSNYIIAMRVEGGN